MPLQLTRAQDSHREPEHTPSNTFPGAADLTAHPKPWEQGPQQHLAHPKPHLSHPTGTCSPGDTPKCWIIDLGWPEHPGDLREAQNIPGLGPAWPEVPVPSCALPPGAAAAQLRRRNVHSSAGTRGLWDAPSQRSHVHLATNCQTMAFGRGESPSWTQNARLGPQLHLPHAAVGHIPSRAPLSSSCVQVWHGDSIPQSEKAPLPEGSGASRASE